MLIVIYTSDGIWIGADSSRSSEGKHLSDVCKIHNTGFGILMKAGASQGLRVSEHVYSTDKEAEDSISSAIDAEDFQQRIEAEYKRDMVEELSIMVDSPIVSPENLTSRTFDSPIPDSLSPDLIRVLLLFRLESETLEGKALVVTPYSEERSTPSSFRPGYKYQALANPEWLNVRNIYPQAPTGTSFQYPRSVHQFSYVTSYPRSEEWVQEHPQQAMTEILQKGHVEKPEEIAPPFTIVHISKTKVNHTAVEWLSRGVCPGWTETLVRPDSLIELRDEQRRERLK